LQTSSDVFGKFRKTETAQTALSALGIYREHGFDTFGLINDFLSLSPPLQEKCKSALSRALRRKNRIDAAAVFKTLANGITVSPRPLRGAADIVIDYVAAVATQWRRNGLRAGRALKEGDSSYTSKFHQFCDLVLTALVEPESRRHLETPEQLSTQSKEAWAAQQKLQPREDWKDVRGGLSRRDSQSLVTAHCLRQGLRAANSKKRARDSIRPSHRTVL